MISSSSYAPGLAGLLSTIRKDDVTQRRRRGTRRNAAGTSGGRLFERRQKTRPVTGGSSYSADRAASLQANRKREADEAERRKSQTQNEIEGRRKRNKALKERMNSPENQALERERKRLREELYNHPEKVKAREEAARLRYKKKRKQWSEDLLESAKDLPDWRSYS